MTPAGCDVVRGSDAALRLVVNPRAGRGRAGRALPAIVGELRRARPKASVEVHRAVSFDDARAACDRAVAAAQPGDSLLVVGGDGMAHVGVNACAGTEVTLGIIPAGTGNDFCRGVGIPSRLRQATQVIADGGVGLIDTLSVGGEIAWPHPARSVGCTVSTGYDALVNARANAIRVPLGPLAYGYVALAELATFSPLPYRLEIDGERRDLEAMLVAVSNSPYFGGGMMISPEADPEDGLLDLTIIHPVGRGKLLRLLPTLYTGAFVRDPAVELVNARAVRVDGDGLFAMADGERIGTVPLDISVAPASLRIHR